MDKKQIAKRVQGMSIDEAATYLMNNYPVTQISEALADLLLTDYQPIKPIIISDEEFNAHFRIKGTTADNQVAKDQLRFKEILRCSYEIMEDYIAVKEQAAALYPEDRTNYRKMKGHFIDAVLRSYEVGVSRSISVEVEQT